MNEILKETIVYNEGEKDNYNKVTLFFNLLNSATNSKDRLSYNKVAFFKNDRGKYNGYFMLSFGYCNEQDLFEKDEKYFLENSSKIFEVEDYKKIIKLEDVDYEDIKKIAYAFYLKYTARPICVFGGNTELYGTHVNGIPKVDLSIEKSDITDEINYQVKSFQTARRPSIISQRKQYEIYNFPLSFILDLMNSADKPSEFYKEEISDISPFTNARDIVNEQTVKKGGRVKSIVGKIFKL